MLPFAPATIICEPIDEEMDRREGWTRTPTPSGAAAVELEIYDVGKAVEETGGITLPAALPLTVKRCFFCSGGTFPRRIHTTLRLQLTT